uniref:Uncharacterized protein n=1 Tax=Steinernema glaseri TaxID=37863 RepID=A0A1I7Y031_9BILA
MIPSFGIHQNKLQISVFEHRHRIGLTVTFLFSGERSVVSLFSERTDSMDDCAATTLREERALSSGAGSPPALFGPILFASPAQSPVGYVMRAERARSSSAEGSRARGCLYSVPVSNFGALVWSFVLYPNDLDIEKLYKRKNFTNVYDRLTHPVTKTVLSK